MLEGCKSAPRKPIFDQGTSFERDVARLGRQAAVALEHAHANDVLHRDVKPSNLLIDEKGHLWITDFGLARIGGVLDLTQTGDTLGTPQYMSPEQALGRRTPVDGRTDVYSLGATLYEILTLARPFAGDDRLDLLRRIIEDEPIPPRKINPRIPGELETIVLKAMAKVPADRYATAADLAEDLGRFLDDRPIRARRPSLLNRAGKWIRRHRKLMAVAGATGLLGAVALAAAVFHYTVWLRRHGVALETEVARANRNADLANDNRRLVNRHLHAAQLRLASQAIENGQLERAQDILQDQVKNPGTDDPRDFAWRVLWERATRQIVPLYGHERNVRVLALCPDGRTLASGDEVGTVRLWDLRAGSAVCVLKGHALSISRLAFSADGSLLVSAAEADSHSQCEVLLWEVATGRELARIDGLENCTALVPVFVRNKPALRLHAAWRELVNGEWSESAIKEIRTYELSHGPFRLELRSSWRSRDYTCLNDAGQIVTFKTVPRPEQNRWTLKDADSGEFEWALDSVRSGASVDRIHSRRARCRGGVWQQCRILPGNQYRPRVVPLHERVAAASPGPQRRRSHARRSLRVGTRRAPHSCRKQAGRAFDERSSDDECQPAFRIFTRWDQVGDDRMGHPRRDHASDHLGRRNGKASGAVSRSP